MNDIFAIILKNNHLFYFIIYFIVSIQNTTCILALQV